MGDVVIQRVYDEGRSREGRRVLVDGLWPRGVSKADLGDIVWLKEVAPSAELRRWFGHQPERWFEFRRRYFHELDGAPAVERLKAMAAEGPLVLLYSARDAAHNNAVALKDYLEGARA
jgi:uncharacterized protein YeaO (DUF488 family)